MFAILGYLQIRKRCQGQFRGGLKKWSNCPRHHFRLFDGESVVGRVPTAPKLEGALRLAL